MKTNQILTKTLIISVIILSFKENTIACGHPPYVETTPVNNPIKKTGYNLIFNDEFNSSQIDSKWDNCYPWGRNLYGNEELEWYSRGNNYQFVNGMISKEGKYTIIDGVLKLIARKESVTEKLIDWLDDNQILEDGKPNKRTFNYTSGMIYSKYSYHYGYFEIKCKIPKGKGLWPAFWLYGGGSCNDEIDVIEFEGASPNIIHTTYHSDCAMSAQEFQIIQSAYADSEYYTYAIEWTPSQVKWFLNNHLLRTINHAYPIPMSIIANLAIASAKVFDGPPSTSANYFPANFEIDYIRAYQKTEDIKPIISGQYEIVKNQNIIFKTSYPALAHTWSYSSGLAIVNDLNNICEAKGLSDGKQVLTATLILEDGSTKSYTKKLLVISNPPSDLSGISGPSSISGITECPNIEPISEASEINIIYDDPCITTYPTVNYNTDIKSTASRYEWSVSPNDDFIQLVPNENTVSVTPLSGAQNKSYSLSVKACNSLGCTPIVYKSIFVSSSEGKIISKSKDVIQNNAILNDLEKAIIVYPNPTKNNIQINLPYNNIYTIEIYDLKGLLVNKLNSYAANEIIDLSEFNSGLYLIKIYNESDVFYTKLLICK